VLVGCMLGPARWLRVPSTSLSFPSDYHHRSDRCSIISHVSVVSKADIDDPNMTEHTAQRRANNGGRLGQV